MEEGFEDKLIEGMANTTSLNNVLLTTYSIINKVWNLYDNIYFDERNGNLIEVSSPDDTQSGNVMTGNTATTISTIVTKRSNYSTTFYITATGVDQTLQSSTINEITPKYTSCYYPSQTNNENYNYNVFYMPWNKDTFIHIIDNKHNKQLATFMFSPGSETKSLYYSPPTDIGLTDYVNDNSTDNNKMVVEPLYDDIKHVYQLSQYVKYDLVNSNLIITTEPTRTLVVYDINKNMNTINSSNNSISSKSRPPSNITAFTVKDSLGQNIVLYIPNKNNVLIGLIGYSDSSKTNLILKNVFRFNDLGIDNGSKTQSTEDSDFSKYWNSSKNDYILKTQIVPPVCPTCPTCPSSGTCSNCGGNGGSGTKTSTGNSMLPNNTGTNQNYSRLGSGTVDSNANPDTIGGSLTLMQYDATSTIEDVAKTGAGVVTGVAGTIGGVANNLISTTGSVLKPNQMGGISTNGQNALGGSGTNQRSTPGYTAPGVGNSNQQSDPYSYYGQLPPKGHTNYVPVTADFSRFGR
uniref:Uncharacterized protein n=1 Tax=viral metagenome TaxID=1070528 RepID=A0A6C0D9S5_9ZZZZ